MSASVDIVVTYPAIGEGHDPVRYSYAAPAYAALDAAFAVTTLHKNAARISIRAWGTSVEYRPGYGSPLRVERETVWSYYPGNASSQPTCKETSCKM